MPSELTKALEGLGGALGGLGQMVNDAPTQSLGTDEVEREVEAVAEAAAEEARRVNDEVRAAEEQVGGGSPAAPGLTQAAEASGGTSVTDVLGQTPERA